MKFFKDEQGNTVIAQKPNKPLIWALVFVALGSIGDRVDIETKVVQVLYLSAYGGFLIWSVLEIVQGVNWLRKLLGVAGLVLTLFSLYRRFLQ